MKFYSGFALEKDDVFFEDLIQESPFFIYGFSYGAIKAYLHVKKAMEEGKRVDRLVLFSPAFFQTKSEKFKRLQKMAYRKNKEQYLQNFLYSCFAPYTLKEITLKNSSLEELEELLEYKWDINGFQKLKNQGVAIEVYLGGKDNVIDVDGAYEFFTQIADVTYIKKANHFLQGE